MAHDRSQAAQERAAKNHDTLAQIGFGAGKIGARSLQAAAVIGTGGAIASAATTVAGTSATGAAVVGTVGTAAEVATPALTVMGAGATVNSLHSAYTNFESGNVAAATDSLGDAFFTGTLTAAPFMHGAEPPSALCENDGCFFAGTPVATENGLRAVEDVRAEERVWAFDLVAREWKLCRVVETYKTEYTGEKISIKVGDEWIESTRHHPVWVAEGKNLDARPRPEHVRQAEVAGATVAGRWVDAGDLETGDVLLLKPDRRATIDEIKVEPIAANVYNFQVEGLHNYAVGFSSVLVHNSACPVGSYTNTHASGKTYSGKGPMSRMFRSGAEKAAAFGDPVENYDWTAAANDEDAFVQEALRLRANGGPGGNTYNINNSPGESILESLGM